MIKINFYIQVLLVAITLLILIVSVFSSGLMFLLLYIQMALGFSQYIGGVLMFLENRIATVKYYLIKATLLLLVLYFWAEFKLPSNEIIAISGMFVLPWLLAIYYWFISYKLYISKSKQ
ncbi:MAG: hypothetical protein RLO12_05955 [Fulvivirga sp.]